MRKGIKPRSDGLRERKKRQTKQSIATAAAKLFKACGYENVRMIDIARAADVAEQTLYNYFPAKEHLIFDMDQEFESRLIGIVIDRDPETSLTDAFRAGALKFLNEASRSIGEETGIPASVARGPELRRVWVEMNGRHADNLAEVLSRDSGGKMHRASAKILARSIVAVFAVTLEELYEGATAGKSRASLLKELRPVIESAILQTETVSQSPTARLS